MSTAGIAALRIGQPLWQAAMQRPLVSGAESGLRAGVHLPQIRSAVSGVVSPSRSR